MQLRTKSVVSCNKTNITLVTCLITVDVCVHVKVKLLGSVCACMYIDGWPSP